jgi:hypothetical protein
MMHMPLHLSIHFAVVSGMQTASYVLDRASSMKRESRGERFSRSLDERKAATGTGFSHEVMVLEEKINDGFGHNPVEDRDSVGAPDQS